MSHKTAFRQNIKTETLSATATIFPTESLFLFAAQDREAIVTAATSMENNRLIVLVSNSACDRKVKADQARALTVLDSRRIPYELVDGVNPAMKER
jgi:hypothetical protein